MSCDAQACPVCKYHLQDSVHIVRRIWNNKVCGLFAISLICKTFLQTLSYFLISHILDLNQIHEKGLTAGSRTRTIRMRIHKMNHCIGSAMNEKQE